MDRLRNLKSIILPFARIMAEDLQRLVSACPLMEVFKVGFAEYYDEDGGSDEMVKIADLSSISQWRHLRECHLLIWVDENELAEDPPECLSPRFADTFMEFKDKELIGRLITEWKRHLSFLEQIEIVGLVDSNHNHSVDALAFIRPLIFGRRCGFEQLHFTWARSSRLWNDI